MNKSTISKSSFQISGLLQKNKQSGDMESRKILKNFGTFLGLLTIARNKAILADEIDFKFLLLEAHLKKYSENSHVELKFVVPFVAKVLEVTKKERGKLFKVSILKVFSKQNEECSHFQISYKRSHSYHDLEITTVLFFVENLMLKFFETILG
jgi:hypothetical protein